MTSRQVEREERKTGRQTDRQTDKADRQPDKQKARKTHQVIGRTDKREMDIDM